MLLVHIYSSTCRSWWDPEGQMCTMAVFFFKIALSFAATLSFSWGLLPLSNRSTNRLNCKIGTVRNHASRVTQPIACRVVFHSGTVYSHTCHRFEAKPRRPRPSSRTHLIPRNCAMQRDIEMSAVEAKLVELEGRGGESGLRQTAELLLKTTLRVNSEESLLRTTYDLAFCSRRCYS